MYCNICGAEIPDGSITCEYCGAKTGIPIQEQVVSSESTRDQPQEPSEKPSKKNKLKASKRFPVILSVCAVVFGILLILDNSIFPFTIPTSEATSDNMKEFTDENALAQQKSIQTPLLPQKSGQIPTLDPVITPTQKPILTPPQGTTITPTQEPTITPTLEPIITPTQESAQVPTQKPNNESGNISAVKTQAEGRAIPGAKVYKSTNTSDLYGTINSGGIINIHGETKFFYELKLSNGDTCYILKSDVMINSKTSAPQTLKPDPAKVISWKP